MNKWYYLIDTETLTITTFLNGVWWGTEEYNNIEELREDISIMEFENLNYKIKEV